MKDAGKVDCFSVVRVRERGPRIHEVCSILYSYDETNTGPAAVPGRDSIQLKDPDGTRSVVPRDQCVVVTTRQLHLMRSRLLSRLAFLNRVLGG